MSFSSEDSKFLVRGFEYVAKSANLQATLENLVKVASECVGSNGGSLYLLDAKRGVLTPCVLYNLPEEYLAGCAEVPLGTQCCGRAALHKVPWTVCDMLTDPLFADCREAARASGIRAAFSVPVLDANGDCLGSLACHFREPYEPTTYALERNRLFAQLIAFAIARRQAMTGIGVQRAIAPDLTKAVSSTEAI
ncbi:MAG TPA: GAF domain-containing protein [Clostridia bacterium]|nr:GAF domain-containing protein [Clostridia bacterium]